MRLKILITCLLSLFIMNSFADAEIYCPSKVICNEGRCVGNLGDKYFYQDLDYAIYIKNNKILEVDGAHATEKLGRVMCTYSDGEFKYNAVLVSFVPLIADHYMTGNQWRVVDENSLRCIPYHAQLCPFKKPRLS